MIAWVKSAVQLKGYDQALMKMRCRIVFWLENDQGNKRWLSDNTYDLTIGSWTQVEFETYMETERDRFKFEVENFSPLDDFWGQEYSTEVTLPD